MRIPDKQPGKAFTVRFAPMTEPFSFPQQCVCCGAAEGLSAQRVRLLGESEAPHELVAPACPGCHQHALRAVGREGLAVFLVLMGAAMAAILFWAKYWIGAGAALTVWFIGTAWMLRLRNRRRAQQSAGHYPGLSAGWTGRYWSIGTPNRGLVEALIAAYPGKITSVR